MYFLQAYTISVKKKGVFCDPHPAVIERRYSDFLDLFLALRKEFPLLMSQVSFPRKVCFATSNIKINPFLYFSIKWSQTNFNLYLQVLIGNFGPVVINARRKGFKSLLVHAAKNERLNQSASLAAFLQNAEQREAQSWMMQKRYDLVSFC